MLDLQEVNATLENKEPQEILTWAWETFGPEMAATSSFQTQSLPLLHMITKNTPEMPVFFLDTGFHFPETLAFRDRLVRELGVRVETIRPEMGHEGFKRRYGDLHQHKPELCCYLNKVQPLQKAMKGLAAWVSGIRRDQTAERSNTPIVGLQANGLYKVCPLARWTRRQVYLYVHEHKLPEHPLLAKGYMSIGCAPCTRATFEGEEERAGRWAGRAMNECGLHIPTDEFELREKNDDTLR